VIWCCVSRHTQTNVRADCRMVQLLSILMLLSDLESNIMGIWARTEGGVCRLSSTGDNFYSFLVTKAGVVICVKSLEIVAGDVTGMGIV
jgi:hypothetical protein